MKKIFLISGKAQAGKDTTANFLKEKLDGRTLIIHNADYLKYIAKQYLGWDGNKDDTGRTLLQYLGTDLVRGKQNKPTFWVEKTCDLIEILKDDFDYFCVPDTRFKNEIYLPKSKFLDDVITIRVNRLKFDNGLTKEQKSHVSETDLDNFHHDYSVYSESGVDKLEKEVDCLIEVLKQDEVL